MDIGYRIKQLRTKNNLTLEELASRCELTKGFLSQLERNLTSPSIATLQDIVEALGTTLAKFFQEETEEKLVFTDDDYFVDEREDCTITGSCPMPRKTKWSRFCWNCRRRASRMRSLFTKGRNSATCCPVGSNWSIWTQERSIPLKKGRHFMSRDRSATV
mgnify:CR=1 FL=1